MNLKIIKPEKAVFEGEAVHVCLPGTMGEFGILDGHASMINGISTGICRFTRPDGSEAKFLVSRGVCKIFENSVEVLASVVETKEDVDPEKAKRNLTDIDSQMISADLDDKSRESLELSRAREEARILLASS